MRLNYINYAIPTLYNMRNKIDPRPDYQRPLAWSVKQKQLLIDSIIRGYDVPKMYWERLTDNNEFDYAVIDGQQRITTIWAFYNDEFSLPRDSDPVDGIEIANKKFSQLSERIISRIDTYQISVVCVEEAEQNENRDEIREMFLRLQNGTTLKAQEKRNAETGNMRDFVKDLAENVFFKNCQFSNSRYAYDHIAAQMVCLELEGGPTSLRDKALTDMYRNNRDFDKNSPKAKKVHRVLSFLLENFKEKNGILERYNVITLYSLASKLLENYSVDSNKPYLKEWLEKFEDKRRCEDKKSEDERDPRFVEYKSLINYSTDGKESIQARLEFWEERFFTEYPDIVPLAKKRNFSHEQRLSIYYRDGGQCQIRIKCDGKEKLGWDNWHADHITAFSNGGETTVSNGQVSCQACNLSKSNS